MKTTYEITREEFLNLKGDKDEGYSELDGGYFCRFGDKLVQKDQLKAIRKGNSKTVFLMRATSSIFDLKSDFVPEITLTIIQAVLVEEHAKEIDRDLVDLTKFGYKPVEG